MVACLIALFLASPLLAMQDLEIGPSELEPFELAVADKRFDSAKRSEIVSNVFAEASEESIDRLMLHENDSVAIQAGWERMVRALAYRCDIEDFREERRVQVNRFLGMIEGRLKAEVPEHWSRTLETIEVFSNNIGWKEWPEHMVIEWGWMKPYADQMPFRTRLGSFEVAVVNEARNMFMISSKNTKRSFTFEIPNDPLIEDDGEMPHVIAAEEDSDSLVVMIHLDDERLNLFNYVIIDVSFNSEGEAVERYRTTVNASIEKSTFSRINHTIDIALQENQLVVFGSCISDVWFDVIERKSGNVRARLTTAYYPFRAYRDSDLKKIDDTLR